MYYTYMLRCIDNTIYTGITIDINRRMQEHFSQGEKCAKYTLNHQPMKLECVWQSDNRILASKLEYLIKTLSKKNKERLILEKDLKKILQEKIDITEYRLC